MFHVLRTKLPRPLILITMQNIPKSSKNCCFSTAKPPEFKVDKDELKKRLTPMQYKVTQEQGTERPFTGEYLKLKDNGMYTCVVCNEELFSSETKFDHGCGWPAFYDVPDSKKVNLKPDLSHDLVRTEVTCFNCGAHLGHLFDDGPKPTGKRYCINSASLKFRGKADQPETSSKKCEQTTSEDQKTLN